MPSFLSNLKSAREYLSPTLKSSAFLTRGVLTPEEFVRAGDELVYKCPTWSWEGGDPAKRKNYLPTDKQYLVTRGVPCTGRVSSLENVVADVANEGCAAMEGDDGEWLVSRILTEEEVRSREDRALEEDFDMLDGEEGMLGGPSLSESCNREADKPIGQNNVDDEGDEYADMADFEDDNVIADEAVAVIAPTYTASNDTEGKGENHNILRVRTYDMSITYDKYYQTPRVFLLGYSDDNTSHPLTGEEMMQDVISDYANKTVTMEYHPHINGVHASIHPCQHGAVMKAIVRNLMKDNDGEGSRDISVEMYMFIFLKFVSSMIPTINYDFTMEVSASTQK